MYACTSVRTDGWMVQKLAKMFEIVIVTAPHPAAWPRAQGPTLFGLPLESTVLHTC